MTPKVPLKPARAISEIQYTSTKVLRSLYLQLHHKGGSLLTHSHVSFQISTEDKAWTQETQAVEPKNRMMFSWALSQPGNGGCGGVACIMWLPGKRHY